MSKKAGEKVEEDEKVEKEIGEEGNWIGSGRRGKRREGGGSEQGRMTKGGRGQGMG